MPALAGFGARPALSVFSRRPDRSTSDVDHNYPSVRASSYAPGCARDSKLRVPLVGTRPGRSAKFGPLFSCRDRDVAGGRCWGTRSGFHFDAYRCAWKCCALTFNPDRWDSKGIELLGSVVWYRGKARIKNIFKRDGPETSASRLLYAGGLPQELVEMIIAHVQLDTQALKACSRTCRSWYIATLPHLHHTLTLRPKVWDQAHGGLIPLWKLNKMRLLPFVERLRIGHCYANPGLPTDIFNARCLAYFSALANIQELGFDRLDLRLFIPQAQPYLGPFMPRLRSLVLVRPDGPSHLPLYLLGLFPNVDDLKLINNHDSKPALPGPVPVLQLSPLLRGRLTLTWFRGEDFFRSLSELSGGLRFRYVDFLGAEGSHFLLGACGKTLETLRIRPMRWPGKGCSQWSLSSLL